MSSLIKAILVSLTSCFTAAAIAGCVAVEPEDDTENVDTVQQPLPECDCYGQWTCPNNSFASTDYDEPGCGPYNKTQARTRCENLCSLTCIDSGWTCL